MMTSTNKEVKYSNVLIDMYSISDSLFITEDIVKFSLPILLIWTLL